MSSNFYTNPPNHYTSSNFPDWENDNFDSSAFVDFSPQPEHQNLPFPQHVSTHHQNADAAQRSVADVQPQPHGQSRQNGQSQLPVSHPSSVSEQSSQSSTSPTARRHAAASPSSGFYASRSSMPQAPQAPVVKTEGTIRGQDVVDGLKFHSAHTNMNTEMDNLSLQPAGQVDFGTGNAVDMMPSDLFTSSEDFPTVDFGVSNAEDSFHSPSNTVQPNKTFFLEGSREQSPNDLFMTGNESPSMGFGPNSPLATLGPGFEGHPNQGFGCNTWNDRGAGLPNTVSSPTARSSASSSGRQSRITFDPVPEKSRVETQIPIRITLHDPPPGIRRIHLPTYTISKPKFQTKPLFKGDCETLELTVLLVCASAMRKSKSAYEAALERAAEGEIPVRKEKSEDEQEEELSEDDPKRPLNGGSVAICPGCQQRERKRAGRKKTKKPEEEEEWLKDEAKRVVVFNCPEVKDFCLAEGNRDVPVKEHPGPLGAMTVYMPMRIACYCRHQQEKLGFQVIFTLKNHRGQMVAQTISPSIMITDDHKQPVPQFDEPQLAYVPTGAVDEHGRFYSHQNLQDLQDAEAAEQNAGRELPFRPSMSTPNLSNMSQSLFQPRITTLPRQLSQTNLMSHPSTASATPRNLSRPASPTNPAGQPGAKKRRSGGSRTNIPSGLHMTALETQRHPPTSASNLGSASGRMSGNFDLASPSSSAFGTTPIDNPMAQASLRTPTHYASGPTTPMHPSTTQLIGEMEMSQYYSAPTSQHASRAPSPNSSSRVQYGSHRVQVPDDTAVALTSLPPGLSITRPPTLQRLIPASGPRSGGEEVTVLGAGFFQGLEVMFGDAPAASTTFWGDSTLVCRAPPSQTPGPVSVCFRHQHRSAPPQVRQLQALMPTRIVSYNYIEDSLPNGMHSMQQMNAMQQAQLSYPHTGQRSGGMGTPTGTGSVSPPKMTGAGSMENLTASGVDPRAYMYMAQGQSPGAGPGSLRFHQANYARTQMAHQEAAQAVAAGRRMAPIRTISGGPGMGRPG